jgi:hypothetical protein
MELIDYFFDDGSCSPPVPNLGGGSATAACLPALLLLFRFHVDDVLLLQTTTDVCK